MTQVRLVLRDRNGVESVNQTFGDPPVALPLTNAMVGDRIHYADTPGRVGAFGRSMFRIVQRTFEMPGPADGGDTVIVVVAEVLP
jgi:hypothetical protein